ncbi:hypothetical protein R1flu_020637 [Riccia fluitans]|uniref:ARM repeat superfamily protein n=1 Tax=Riccia fluitans TaxID=41844 RepID=A0ABD1ZQJ3_9MARC
MEGEVAFSASGVDPLQPDSVFGSKGFRAPRWRTRLAAIEFALQHCVIDDGLSSAEKALGFKFCEQVVRALLYDLALRDSQWQVRKAAVESATTILLSAKDSLSPSSFADNILGVLAIFLDPQPEVHETASRCILEQLLPTSSREVHVAVLTLCDRFIRAAVQVDDLQAGKTKSSGLSRRKLLGLDNVPGGEVLLAGVTAVACLQLLPLPGDEVIPPQPPEVDIIPLLLLVTAVAFEDAQKRESRVLAKDLTRFLRCMGLGVYRRSLLSMLNPHSSFYLPGMNLLKPYKKSGHLDEDTADVLIETELPLILKALAVALDPCGVEELANRVTVTSLSNPGSSDEKVDLCEEDFIVLQHIVEMTCVPSVLTTTLKDETAEIESRKFLELAYPLLNISKFILEKKVWVSTEAPFGNELVGGLILCCATFAGGGAENSGAVLWTTKEHGELATSFIICLHKSLNAPRSNPLNGDHSGSECSGDLVSLHLPSLLPRLKQIIKGESVSGEGLRDFSGNLSSSVIAAHQMEWCLQQLEHQKLALHIPLIMPCVLTAMDHFSREVKGYAMRSLLHLAKNLSATEFQWNKDVVLDAVCRNLTGSEELWPTAVKLAVKTVTCYEGDNVRSSWYRQIFNGMLEELDRQRDSQERRVVWLQEITPQLEAMGLILVVHFSKLLPLLYYWLHAPDDTTCLSVLARLRTIIIYTWPRVPAHMQRLTMEVVKTYYEASSRKAVVDVQTAAVEVLQLLKLCGGQEVAEALQEERGKCVPESAHPRSLLESNASPSEKLPGSMQPCRISSWTQLFSSRQFLCNYML